MQKCPVIREERHTTGLSTARAYHSHCLTRHSRRKLPGAEGELAAADEGPRHGL